MYRKLFNRPHSGKLQISDNQTIEKCSVCHIRNIERFCKVCEINIFCKSCYRKGHGRSKNHPYIDLRKEVDLKRFYTSVGDKISKNDEDREIGDYTNPFKFFKEKYPEFCNNIV